MNKWFAGCDNVKLFELHKKDTFNISVVFCCSRANSIRNVKGA